MTGKTVLEVNGVTIKLDRFVREFVFHTVSGMVGSLDNTGPITGLILTLEGKDINILLNGSQVGTNEFVNKIIKSTLFGMVCLLKGVNTKSIDELKSLKIEITNQAVP
jgi:hypothetical protein